MDEPHFGCGGVYFPVGDGRIELLHVRPVNLSLARVQEFSFCDLFKVATNRASHLQYTASVKALYRIVRID
jgi:hypothetical protein